MNARRVLVFLGSLWDLCRFFLTLSIVVATFGSQGGQAAALVPWLLVACASCLLVPAGGVLLSLYPGRYGNLAALLALGKILNIFSFVLLVLAGPLSIGARTTLFRIGKAELPPLAVLPAVALFDLIFFIILVSFMMDLRACRNGVEPRPGDGVEPRPRDGVEPRPRDEAIAPQGSAEKKIGDCQ